MDALSIDITGSGDNSLTLNHRAVVDLAGKSGALMIRRNLSDTVDFGGEWKQLADETIDGTLFNVYRQGNAILKVQSVASKSAGKTSITANSDDYSFKSVETTSTHELSQQDAHKQTLPYERFAYNVDEIFASEPDLWEIL